MGCFSLLEHVCQSLSKGPRISLACAGLPFRSQIVVSQTFFWVSEHVLGMRRVGVDLVEPAWTCTTLGVKVYMRSVFHDSDEAHFLAGRLCVVPNFLAYLPELACPDSILLPPQTAGTPSTYQMRKEVIVLEPDVGLIHLKNVAERDATPR